MAHGFGNPLNIPQQVKPADGSLYVFTNGAWQPVDGSQTYVTLATPQTISGAKTLSGITTVSNTTTASSPTVGALVVGNGATATSVAIGAGKIYLGSSLNLGSGTTNADGIIWGGDTYLYRVAGGVPTFEAAGNADVSARVLSNTVDFRFSAFSSSGVAQVGTTSSHPLNLVTGTTARIAISAAGLVQVTDTTDATSTTSASLAIAGGLGVAKRICLDGASGKTLRITNGVANAAVAVTFTGVGPTGSTAGPPQGWMRIDINGTDRYIPYW